MKAIRTIAPLLLAAAACGGENAAAPLSPAPAAPTAPAPVANATPTPAPPQPHADASLIKRSVFMSNPENTNPVISPDGKQIAYLAPVDGVLNVMVAPADDITKAKPATHDKTRPVDQFWWPEQSSQILYAQDNAGDENWHVYAVTLATGDTKDLTPYQGVSAQLQSISPKHPGEVLIGMNDRDAKYHDLYRVDLKTGARTLVQKNDGGFSGFVADDDYKPRLAVKSQPDGSSAYSLPGAKNAYDVPLFNVPFEDALTTNPVGMDPTGRTLYLIDSRDRDTAGLFAFDLGTKKATLLAEDLKSDVQGVFAHPKTHKPLVAVSNYDRERHIVIDPSVKADEDYLKTVVPGADFGATSCSEDMKRCIVQFTVSDGPIRFYRYDRDKHATTFLFVHRPKLQNLKLAKMTPEIIPSRDGLNLVSYLSLPAANDPDGDGKPDHPMPMVLWVHGGPWGRDTWGYNRYHQWFTNRGYAVLSVNYRGSTGFGKKFVNAGNREWAGKMHDDLIDAVTWAEKSGVADPQRVAIAGGSYGGYATLVGVTFTPDTFACGVDEFGISNLNTFANSIPPYWTPFIEQLAKRVGDFRQDADKQFLASRSPISHVDAIKKPLLIGQGANDVRVKQAESDQIVHAMQAKGIPVTYVLFSDEGHGFTRPENETAFNAVAETFLAQCLGGSYQPIEDDFSGSTIKVPFGAEGVYGVSDALKGH
jgi:dipeptidyl aminopeptidase/acylaminoacyl peptidase